MITTPAEENIQQKRNDVEVEDTEEQAKKREVVDEPEQKIQTGVKEISKVFCCELCHKQYKVAVKFEGHLSSYDHNHRKKRELQREEREMAKFAKITDAHKQQQQHEQEEQSVNAPVSAPSTRATALTDQDQRKALKFVVVFKSGLSKYSFKGPAKKPKIPIASVFGNGSDEE